MNYDQNSDSRYSTSIGRFVDKAEDYGFDDLTDTGAEAVSRERAIHRGFKALKAAGAVLIVGGVLFAGDAIMNNESEHEPGQSYLTQVHEQTQAANTDIGNGHVIQGTDSK